MGTDAWARGRPTAGAEAAGARPRAADRQERHLSSEIGKGSSGPSRGASEGALPRARAQTSVLEDGEGPHPVLSPPQLGDHCRCSLGHFLHVRKRIRPSQSVAA